MSFLSRSQTLMSLSSRNTVR